MIANSLRQRTAWHDNNLPAHLPLLPQASVPSPLLSTIADWAAVKRANDNQATASANNRWRHVGLGESPHLKDYRHQRVQKINAHRLNLGLHGIWGEYMFGRAGALGFIAWQISPPSFFLCLSWGLNNFLGWLVTDTKGWINFGGDNILFSYNNIKWCTVQRVLLTTIMKGYAKIYLGPRNNSKR